MHVRLSDGYEMFVQEVGSGFPLVVLHGGPGLDHSSFRPWLDPLGDELRLLYVDERGQGRSARVDPETLSLEVFARDVDQLAEALGLDRFALLGHSFGAIVTTWHAIELGTAAAYVISGGGDASEPMLADVEASLAAMGEEGAAITESWEREKTVESEEELNELLRTQMPFHFHGEPPPGYGDFDYRPRLREIRRPTLIVVGEHDRTTSVRAARVLHEGIEGSELVVVPNAGHMSFVEAQEPYLDAMRTFLRRVA